MLALETTREGGVADLMRVTGLPRRTPYDLRQGKTTTPNEQTLAAITKGITVLEAEQTQR
jgi:hypothetical protein